MPKLGHPKCFLLGHMFNQNNLLCPTPLPFPTSKKFLVNSFPYLCTCYCQPPHTVSPSCHLPGSIMKWYRRGGTNPATRMTHSEYTPLFFVVIIMVVEVGIYYQLLLTICSCDTFTFSHSSYFSFLCVECLSVLKRVVAIGRGVVFVLTRTRIPFPKCSPMCRLPLLLTPARKGAQASLFQWC